MDREVDFIWECHPYPDGCLDAGVNLSGVKDMGKRIPTKINITLPAPEILECLLVRIVLTVREDTFCLTD